LSEGVADGYRGDEWSGESVEKKTIRSSEKKNGRCICGDDRQE
jgi:hypothetical protein